MEIHGDRLALPLVEPPQVVPQETVLPRHDVIGQRAGRHVTHAGVAEDVGQRQRGDVAGADVLDDHLEAHRVADRSAALHRLQQTLGQTHLRRRFGRGRRRRRPRRGGCTGWRRCRQIGLQRPVPVDGHLQVSGVIGMIGVRHPIHLRLLRRGIVEINPIGVEPFVHALQIGGQFIVIELDTRRVASRSPQIRYLCRDDDLRLCGMILDQINDPLHILASGYSALSLHQVIDAGHQQDVGRLILP